ncbi:MAG: glycosyltransferase [Rikenellaceae bacterium]
MKVCAIFNIAPHYRRAIYELMQQELDIDIFVGDHSSEGIASLDMGADRTLRNRYRGRKLVWQSGAWSKAFGKRYEAYILTGNAGILSNWLIALAARLCGCRVYLWSHGLKGSESRLERWKNMLYFKVAGNALLYGERGARLLAERGFKKSTVIYNSLDYDTQLALRERVGDGGFLRNYFGNDLPVICYLGRLTPFKRVDLLLDAMTRLECNLVVVGGGEIQEGLRTRGEQLGVMDRVWFYGECYDQQFLATLISHARVVVNPSSIGLTVIHSFMFGTPVVTHSNFESQMPEAEIIEDGVTGFLFTEGSLDGLVSAVDEALRGEKPTQQCYQAVDTNYNPSRQIEILKKLFNDPR